MKSITNILANTALFGTKVWLFCSVPFLALSFLTAIAFHSPDFIWQFTGGMSALVYVVSLILMAILEPSRTQQQSREAKT